MLFVHIENFEHFDCLVTSARVGHLCVLALRQPFSGMCTNFRRTLRQIDRLIVLVDGGDSIRPTCDLAEVWHTSVSLVAHVHLAVCVRSACLFFGLSISETSSRDSVLHSALVHNGLQPKLCATQSRECNSKACYSIRWATGRVP